MQSLVICDTGTTLMRSVRSMFCLSSWLNKRRHRASR